MPTLHFKAEQSIMHYAQYNLNFNKWIKSSKNFYQLIIETKTEKFKLSSNYLQWI